MTTTRERDMRQFYVTSFCNFAHATKSGRPIGHECYIIPPALLVAERDLPFDEAMALWRPWYSRKGPTMQGGRQRQAVKDTLRGMEG